MYDILIIGGGTAGMTCAITAAQQGARVGVVEKSDHIGGALHWSGGHMSAGGTRRQKEKGIADSVEKHYKDILNITDRTGDLDLIRMAVEEAPHTIDWLDDLGFEFAPECPRIIYGHIPYTEARTHYGVDKAMSIYKVIKPLWDDQVQEGNIELFLNHTLVGLEKIDGRYTTALTDSGRDKVKFQGRHIVMTTGGYGSNPAFFDRKHPGVPLMSSAYPTAMGDGHAVVENAGGAFKYGEFHIPSLGGVELTPGRCNFNTAWANVLTSVYRSPKEIYVNESGRRFMREDEMNADTRERLVAEKSDYKFWAIFDESAIMEKEENGNYNPIMLGETLESIKAESKNENYIWSAPTLEALALKTGLPIENLKSTVLRFNNMTLAQKDEDYGRAYLNNTIEKPPFYALLIHASVLVTFGGMHVDKELQVLDESGKVMEGLYGAGEFLGLGATSGKAFCSGMAITPALSFGRILGKRLASS